MSRFVQQMILSCDITFWKRLCCKLSKLLDESLSSIKEPAVGDHKEIVEQNSEIQGLERACSTP